MFSLDEILIINERILFSLIDFDIFVFLMEVIECLKVSVEYESDFF